MLWRPYQGKKIWRARAEPFDSTDQGRRAQKCDGAGYCLLIILSIQRTTLAPAVSEDAGRRVLADQAIVQAAGLDGGAGILAVAKREAGAVWEGRQR